MKQGYLDFDAYIRQGEPDKCEKASIWRTAIGLQAVDGLQTSEYLRETAIKHIEGEIDIDEARQLIQAYYQSKTHRETTDDDMQEADQVSANITKILSSNTLDFSAKGYISLHRRIFDGVFKHAGKVRDYDISKNEWILNGDTVHYLNWEDLHRALDYDIEQERRFSYKGLSTDQLIQHIAQHLGHHLHSMHLALDLRDAVTGNIDRNYTHRWCQQRCKIVPHVHRLKITVQQHYTLLSYARIGYMQGCRASHQKFLLHSKMFLQA